MSDLYEGDRVIIIKSKLEHMIGKQGIVSEILDDDICFIRIGMRKRRYKIKMNNLMEIKHPSLSKNIKY